MNHKSKNAHLSCSAVVQLDGSLLHEFFLGSGPLEHTVSQVSWEFSSSGVLHDKDFKESNEGNDLGKSSRWDVGKSSNSSLDGGERGTGVVNVSRNAGSESGVDVSENGKHSNTSVLDFDVSKTVESFLIGVLKEVQRVPVRYQQRHTQTQEENKQNDDENPFLRAISISI